VLVAAAAGVAIAAGPGGAKTSASVAVSCPAAIVHHEPNARLGSLSGGPWIRAHPVRTTLIGYMFGGHEVNGRFAVYAGGEDPVSHRSQKILWILKPGARAAARLRIDGVRLALGPHGVRRVKTDRFHESFASAYSEQTPGILFPSSIDVPRAGCWRLTLGSGHISARVVVIAEAGTVGSVRG
jgi:hypothetical protein